MVAVSSEARRRRRTRRARRTQASLLDEARADPLVQKLLQRFPGAEIVGVRERGVRDGSPEPDRVCPTLPGEATTEGED